MHKIALDIMQAATTAGEVAADVEYDALVPETARELRADIVPGYAEEAAIEIVSSMLRVTPREVRGTRLVAMAIEAWASAFRAAWPADAVAVMCEERAA